MGRRPWTANLRGRRFGKRRWRQGRLQGRYRRKQVAFLGPPRSWPTAPQDGPRGARAIRHVESLSRFKTGREESGIKSKLGDGKIDIIIGTHKLLSDKIKFKDLGLVIIDEEQRFGVAQKEKLRKIKEGVDTISLSATPIPRTLQLSLAKIRDISLINTPRRQADLRLTYINRARRSSRKR
jgi:hypothetical protein